jgi:predicted esterase
VYYPSKYPSLKRAKRRVYWIDHGKEDKQCDFKLAEQARDDLKKHGAKVEFAEQPGGHGWAGPVYPRIAKGFRWLEKNHAKPVRK